MKTYMVVEHFGDGKVDEIYERFHQKGRMLPEGLHYVDSWLALDGLRCFQLMKTADIALFDEWEKHWSDLASFDIVEIRDKPQG